VPKGGHTQHPRMRATNENDRKFTMVTIVTTSGSIEENLIQITEEVV
jgi:hypothetical protein